MDPVTACPPTWLDLTLAIEHGGYDHLPYQLSSQEEHPFKDLLQQVDAFNEHIDHLHKRMKKLKQQATAYMKAMRLQLLSVQSLGKTRNPGQRAHRAHRSTTKSNKSSSSSDSDGEPSASDPSARRISCRIPLLHYLSFSSISAVNPANNSILHFCYGYVRHAIFTPLTWPHYISSIVFQLNISTSSQTGVSHV